MAKTVITNLVYGNGQADTKNFLPEQEKSVASKAAEKVYTVIKTTAEHLPQTSERRNIIAALGSARFIISPWHTEPRGNSIDDSIHYDGTEFLTNLLRLSDEPGAFVKDSNVSLAYLSNTLSSPKTTKGLDKHPVLLLSDLTNSSIWRFGLESVRDVMRGMLPLFTQCRQQSIIAKKSILIVKTLDLSSMQIILNVTQQKHAFEIYGSYEEMIQGPAFQAHMRALDPAEYEIIEETSAQY